MSDPAEVEKFIVMLKKKYPEYMSMPAPDFRQVRIFRLTQRVISVLDCTKGFAHADVVTVLPWGAVAYRSLRNLREFRGTPERNSPVLAVRVVPLPQDAERLLEGFVAPAPAPSGGLWSRLKSATLDRKALADRAQKARAALGRRACEDVEIWHDAPPALAQHEHGIFVFVHAGAYATLLLDVSSVAEDARWALYQENRLLLQRWHWYRFPGLAGPWCFTTDGPPVMPLFLGDFHGTALETRLTEEMDWPGDDALLPLPLEEIVRLARQRAAA